jgi:hypothetical protein
MLHEQKKLSRINVGDSTISAVSLDSARELYLNLLNDDPNYFITEPFDKSKVTDEFVVTDMVAL